MLQRLFAIMAVWLCAAAAMAEPPPIEDYGKLPGVELVSLSPSGQRYAMVAVVGDQRRVLVVDAADNNPIEIQNIGVAKVDSLRWVDDDRLLIFHSVTAKLDLEFSVRTAELMECTVLNIASKTAVLIFGNKYQTKVASMISGYFGYSENDGHHFGYFGGYSYNSVWDGGDIKTTSRGLLYADLYRVDLDTGDFKLELKMEPGRNEWLVSREGEVVAHSQFDSGGGTWRVAAGRTGANLLTGRSATGAVSLRGFGRSAETILVEAEEDGRNILHEVSLVTEGSTAKFEIDRTGMPIIDDATGLWIGNRAADEGKVTLFDPVRQARVAGAFKAFPGYFVDLRSFSADFRRMIVFADGGGDSGGYWMVDIDKHSAEQIGRAYPTVRTAHVGPVRWVDYKAADGLAMRGVLTLPPGRTAKNLPLVVLPHGGPESYDTPGFDYMAQAFAARGYAAFQPNFRGSGGSGDAFRYAGYGQWGRKMQTDISDGVSELSRQGLVDPKRACIIGVGYGGYAALAGVTLQQGVYRCAVSYDGYSDLAAVLTGVTTGSGAISASARAWRRYLGADAASDSGLDDISPAEFAGRTDAPILLMRGKDDNDVFVDQTRRMERALKAAGKPVDVILIPGADPVLIQEPSRIAMLKASVAFVMKHNPPDAPPAH